MHNKEIISVYEDDWKTITELAGEMGVTTEEIVSQLVKSFKETSEQ